MSEETPKDINEYIQRIFKKKEDDIEEAVFIQEQKVPKPIFNFPFRMPDWSPFKDSGPPPAQFQPTPGRFIWPIEDNFGRISSGYGPRWGKIHRGIDIAQSSSPILGKRILAVAPGRVVTSRFNEGGYGWYIIIDHGDKLWTLYAHNQKNLVRIGDVVRQGQPIGHVGSTGNSTGPHLHFEVRPGVNSQKHAVDPMGYLPRRS